MIVPNNVKRTYKILVIGIVVMVVAGLILKMPQLYFGYPMGALASLLTLYTLNKEVYEMVYIKEKNIRSPFGYYKRLFITGISLLLVGLISKRFFPSNVEANIALAGLGLISSKVSLFINKKIFK